MQANQRPRIVGSFIIRPHTQSLVCVVSYILDGAADSYVGLAFTEIDDIVEYIKNNSKLSESDKEIGRR